MFILDEKAFFYLVKKQPTRSRKVESKRFERAKDIILLCFAFETLLLKCIYCVVYILFDECEFGSVSSRKTSLSL